MCQPGRLRNRRSIRQAAGGVAEPYTVQPVAVVNNPPVIVAEVEAPEPPEAPERYGNAQWMKVLFASCPRTVTLDELITENPEHGADGSGAA